MHAKHHKKILSFGVGILLLLIVLFIISFRNTGFFDSSRVSEPRYFIGFFSLQVLESIVPFLPGFVLTILAGYSFGPLIGALLAICAVLIGSTIVFFAANSLKGFVYNSSIKKEALHFEKFMQAKGDFAVLLVRVVPIFPNAIISLSASLGKMPYKRFLLYSAIGLVPQQTVLAFFGSSLIDFSSFSIIFLLVFMAFVLIFSFRGRIKKLLLKEIAFIDKEITRLERQSPVGKN